MKDWKKLLAGALIPAMVLPLSACGGTKAPQTSAWAGKVTDGVYSGVGHGYGGEVAVTVTVENGRLTDVELGENSESLVVIERAFPLLRERILAADTAQVDSVTGATYSSYAVKTAVAGAMAQAGMAAPDIGLNDQKEYPEATLEDVKTDILIIGGGPAGLAAAITAKETNPDAKVLVAEKLDILSGNGKFDLNFYDMFNSEAQKAAGVEDSKEQFLEDRAEAVGIPERLAVWADGEEVVDAWLRSFGVTLDYNYGKRNHMATQDDYAGQMIQREMEKQAYALGVEIRTGTAGTDLVFDGDRVAGAVVKTNHNQVYTIRAGQTIVATGGFSCSQELLAQYAPNYVNFPTSNQLGATGDFVPVFEKYGFGLAEMDRIRVIPLILQPSRDLTNSGAGTVLVNQDGVRFVNERNGDLSLAEPIRDQESAWMVVDSQKVVDHANVRKQVKEGRFEVCDTLAAAAEVIGCDAAALEETFRVYNEHARAGAEDRFGLVPERAILEEGPYYVSKVSSAIHMTKGGVTCDERARVLYSDGSPVPGLYAAGEVTWQSGGYSQSVVFGRVAGEQAALALSR